jgi:single-stranded-DNA-specific exonuclease
MQKRWLVQDLPEITVVKQLQDELKIPQIIASLLIQRGIKSFDEARNFFRPSLDDLHNPFLMKGMSEAVERLIKAKEKQEKILIFGDYDVDGTTAVAQMVLFFQSNDFIIDYYIPDRYAEGYGISIAGIDYAADNQCSIFLALDCGIKAVEKIAYARKKGLDVIICDHHTPGEEIPDAIVLDPKQIDCNYPYKELSGCGIGFKLLQGLTEQLQLSKDTLFQLLDLNAISIAADIVPVTGENRILAYHGVKQINEKPLRKGLQAMLDCAKKTIPLDFTSIVFVLAPRINAAGRIHSGKIAVDLLISSGDNVTELAMSIEEDNSTRRLLDQSITEEILADLKSDLDYQKKKTTVVYGENWHKGVIGIVASRLIETYYRPTVVLTKSNDVAAGSVRSVADFNVYDALEACSEYMIQFGGHKYAAGLTIEIDKIEAFAAKFEEVVNKQLTDKMCIPKQVIDLPIPLNELFQTNESYIILPKIQRLLSNFEPFGPGNMKPVFHSKNVFIDPNSSRIVGDNHLKVKLFSPGMNFLLDGIGFNLGHKLSEFADGQPIEVLYTLEENTWNEKTTLQLNIKDLICVENG